MLQKVSHIEGYDDFENVELYDDTNPGATQVRFDLVSEEMPGLTALEGRVIRKNFVWITKTMHLGQLVVKRRINDEITYSEEQSKWIVKKFAIGQSLDGTPVSDIKRYPGQWNAFNKNNSSQVIGTPLSLLFKADPTKVEMYKFHHIETIEQLANMGEIEIEGVGMGARADREKARAYQARAKEQAPQMHFAKILEDKEQQIASLQNQLSGLSSKLDEILAQKIEQPDYTRNRKSNNKKITLIDPFPEVLNTQGE